MQTDRGVDISSVKAVGVHFGSFNIFLVFWTDGDDDQDWRLFATITESAVPVFPGSIIVLTYIHEVPVHPTHGAV